MTEEVQSENKMGYMPIPKLLFTMSIPMIISMLVQALYNVVDSAFVAKRCLWEPVWVSMRCFPDPWEKSSLSRRILLPGTDCFLEL